MTESLLNNNTTENATTAVQQPQGTAAPTTSTAPVETAWQKMLSLVEDEGIRTNKSFAKFQKPDDLFKSYAQLEATLGADKNSIVKIPNVPYSESPEAWTEFYDRMGRPKDHKEYGIKAPEGSQADSDTIDKFTQLAHQSGLTKFQTEALSKWYFDNQKSAFEVQAQGNTAKYAAAVTSLKSEFGEAYDDKISDAKKAILAQGGQDLLDSINRAGLGADPVYIKAMAKEGAKLREDGMVRSGGDPNQADRKLSPTEARQKFNEYAADKKFQDILYTRGHPQQTWAKSEIDRLVRAGAMDR